MTDNEQLVLIIVSIIVMIVALSIWSISLDETKKTQRAAAVCRDHGGTEYITNAGWNHVLAVCKDGTEVTI